MELPVHINLARLNQIQLLNNIIKPVFLNNIPERFSVGYFEVLRPIYSSLSILPHAIRFNDDDLMAYTPKFPNIYIRTMRESDLSHRIPSVALNQFFIKYFYVRCFIETGRVDYTTNNHTDIGRFYVKVTELDLRLLEELILSSISTRELPSYLGYFVNNYTQAFNEHSWELLRDLYSNIKDYRDKGFTVYFYAY